MKKEQKSHTNLIVLFLKWFFVPRGTTKVHPYALLTQQQRLVAESLPVLKYKAGYQYTYHCKVCGCECQSMKKHPKPPVCTTWWCFRDYFLGNQKVVANV